MKKGEKDTFPGLIQVILANFGYAADSVEMCDPGSVFFVKEKKS